MAAGQFKGMMERLALASLIGIALWASPAAQAQGSATPGPETPGPEISADDPQASACPPEMANDCPRTAPAPERDRLFPLGGRAAIARGYRIPEPWGIGALMVWTNTNFNSRDLSVAVRKGGAPSADAPLAPLPAVTTNRLEGDNRMLGLKGDLWLFPGVNLFASIGKVKGTNQIDIDVDLDAVIPFPFCRPAKPCGTIRLPVETRVNNTTVTLGTILVYGNEHWFVLGSAAKTLSISSKERSDVESTNIGLRGGPRFKLAENTYFAPYMGANYFDLDTTVKGLVESPAVFEDGDSVHLRYKVDMSASHPWAAVAGFNVELNRHLSFQAEIQAGAESTRILASAGVRF